MTCFPGNRYDSPGVGVSVIPQGEGTTYDFARLERAVASLAKSHRRLEQERAALRRELEDKNRRLRALDVQLIEANQRRQDVIKRVDELIAQIDQLDAQLGALEE